MSGLPDLSAVALALSGEERRALERFASQVERLVSRSFFQKCDGGTLTIRGATEDGLTVEHDLPGDEPLAAVLPVFRQLYTDHEPASAVKATKIISAAAYRANTPESRMITTLARDHRRGANEIRSAAFGVALTHNGKPLTNAEIVDLWLNGDHMHWDAAKAAVLEAWPAGILYLQLTLALRAYSQAWWNLKNFVRLILTADRRRLAA